MQAFLVRVLRHVRWRIGKTELSRQMYPVLRDATGESPIAILLRMARLQLRPRRRVLFYPRRLSRYDIAWRLSLLCGYRVVMSPKRQHDLLFAHDRATVHPSIPPPRGDATPAVNRHATDISKRTVEARFEEVFGYALGLDPARHHGLAIRKSNENYTHDAVVVECPRYEAPDEGVTYQRYIDTRTVEGYFLDVRVPIYDGTVPIVYLKYRPDTDDRFDAVAYAAVVLNPLTVFSAHELSDLARLAESMGIDYGEMDVLRDNEDGRIYVVDVNPTPAGLYKGFRRDQRQLALQHLQPAFAEMIERRCVAAPQSQHPS